MLLNNSSKLNHESFISNLNGTTINENYLLISLPILLNTCMSFLSVNLFQLGFGKIKGNLVVNYLMVIIPFILSITIFSNYLLQITLTVAATSFLLLSNSLILSKSNKYLTEIRLTLHSASNKRESWLYMSQMRGLILMMTTICILAVDMKVFPRRFAKTEMFGFGPMDLGVGLFAIIYGLLDQIKVGSFTKLSSIGILLVLGIMRTVLVKYGNYQEHESEYGTHWNFFLTMAALKLVSIITKYFRFTQRIFGIITMIMAVSILQYFLLYGSFNLEKFCNDNKVDRTKSLLVANKEGLISLIGYIVLWLTGCLLGAILTRKFRKSLAVFAALATIGLYISQCFLHKDIVSRRAANFGYVLWTTSSFCFCLMLFIISDILINWLEDRANFVNDTENPDIYCVVNRQAMAFFLLSNILTGLTNVTIKTMELNKLESITTLVIYTILVLITTPHINGIL